MKRLVVVFFLLLSIFGYSQINIDINIKRHFKIESYIICIGNEDKEVYNSCLGYLETSSNFKITYVCDNSQTIGLRSTYKNFDVVRGVLNHEFPDMIFFRTEEEIKCNE